MNPQQPSSVPLSPAQDPSPQMPARQLPPNELRELGLVAIEEPQPLPGRTPETQDPSEVIISLQEPPRPAAQPIPVAPAPSEDPPLPPAKDPLEAQPAVPPEQSVSPPIIDAPPTQPDDQPAIVPTFVITPTSPNTGAPPLATPAMAPAAPPTRAADVAAPPAQPELPELEPSVPTVPGSLPPEQSVPSVEQAPAESLNNGERMDLSANSMQLRKVGRLHTLNVLLYLVIVALAAGVLIGGFYLRKYLISGS